MIEKLIHINTIDNEKVALWKVTSEKSLHSKPLFLTHGTFSNKKILKGLTSYFIKKGFTCWIMEWRNHGKSTKTTKPFNFETIAIFDVPAVFQYLFQKEKITQLDCITHSGGGLVLSMFLVNTPSYISKINTITFFGTQSFGAATTFFKRIKITIAKYISASLGFVPAKSIGSSEHNESYQTMKQWFNWNLHRNFVGKNGFNYQEKLDQIIIPILSICAKGDTFIAPKKGCTLFLDSFKNPKNKLVYCAIKNGFLEDYNHGRIILSNNAKKEIYPLVLNWIQQ